MEQTLTTLNVYSRDGDSVTEAKISPQWLDFVPNPSVVHEYVVGYLRNQRQWSACTKTRAEVSGSGKKPWKQKGTGRARAGSLVSPIFRGGGIVFGPKPKDVRVRVPKKVKQLALKSAIYQRIKEGCVRIIDDIKLDAPRTKAIVEMLKKIDIAGKVLVVLGNKDENVQLSMRNISYVTCCRVDSLNAYNVVAHPRLLFTRDSISRLGVIEKDGKDQAQE